MRSIALAEIAACLSGRVEGDPTVRVCGIRPLGESKPGDLALLLDRKSVADLERCRASALVAPEGLQLEFENTVRVQDARKVLPTLLGLFWEPVTPFPGVHPTAVVSPDAEISEGVSIGAGSFVDAGANIGPGAVLYPGVYVGKAVVGEESVLFPGVCVYSGARIGKRVIIHGGSVIGSDGFGYQKNPDGQFVKIPQIGAVEIGDDVEIGANCAIDRATIGTTTIRSGTKIDNLVQIGHNTILGRDCCIIAQVGISGSVEIGDGCVLAGQVGVADHVKLADHVTVGAKSGVMKDLSSGEWVGYPAIPASEGFRVYALLARLPEMRRQIKELEKRCAELEARLEKQSPERK